MYMTGSKTPAGSRHRASGARRGIKPAACRAMLQAERKAACKLDRVGVLVWSGSSGAARGVRHPSREPLHHDAPAGSLALRRFASDQGLAQEVSQPSLLTTRAKRESHHYCRNLYVPCSFPDCSAACCVSQLRLHTNSARIESMLKCYKAYYGGELPCNMTRFGTSNQADAESAAARTAPY
jgi:hypothetical protein